MRIKYRIIDGALAGVLGVAAVAVMRDLPPTQELLRFGGTNLGSVDEDSPRELWYPDGAERDDSRIPALQGRMAAEYLVTSTSDRPTVTPPGMTAYRFS